MVLKQVDDYLYASLSFRCIFQTQLAERQLRQKSVDLGRWMAVSGPLGDLLGPLGRSSKGSGGSARRDPAGRAQQEIHPYPRRVVGESSRGEHRYLLAIPNFLIFHSGNDLDFGLSHVLSFWLIDCALEPFSKYASLLYFTISSHP